MRRLAVAAALVLAACTSGTATANDGVDESTTTTTVPSGIPSTVEPFDEGRPTLMNPGVTYEYTDLPVTVRFTFQQEQWQSDFGGSTLVASVQKVIALMKSST